MSNQPDITKNTILSAEVGALLANLSPEDAGILLAAIGMGGVTDTPELRGLMARLREESIWREFIAYFDARNDHMCEELEYVCRQDDDDGMRM